MNKHSNYLKVLEEKKKQQEPQKPKIQYYNNNNNSNNFTTRSVPVNNIPIPIVRVDFLLQNLVQAWSTLP